MKQTGSKKPFLIVGIILVIFGIRSIIGNAAAAKTYDAVMGADFLLEMVDVQAVCTKVEPVQGGKMNYISGYDVYVTYDFDGKTYEDVPIEHYELKIQEGDTVDVKVPKDVPALCYIDYPGAYYNYYTVLGYVIFGVGVLFVALFFILRHKSI